MYVAQCVYSEDDDNDALSAFRNTYTMYVLPLARIIYPSSSADPSSFMPFGLSAQAKRALSLM